MPQTTLQFFIAFLSKCNLVHSVAVIVVFTRFLYGRYSWGVRVYHGRGRRRRYRRRGLRKPLHGLFARYVSYFKRVIFLLYDHILYTCAHVIRMHFIFFFIFFVPSCDELSTVEYVEVDHYYRNLTSPKKRKMYVKNDFPPARGHSRPCLVVCFETVDAVKGVCVCVCIPSEYVHDRYGGSGSGPQWWWWVIRFSGQIFPPLQDFRFIYKLRTTAVSVPLSVFTSFNIQYCANKNMGSFTPLVSTISLY